MFFDFKAFERRVQEALDRYEKDAPQVARYLDELYVRVSKNAADVRLVEIRYVENLCEEGTWWTGNYAQNRLYHLFNDLGRDLTGMSDH